MWIALDIFIGLTLCYALISLFCSVIQEFIAQALDSRSTLLADALKDANLRTVIDNAAASLVKNPSWLMRLPWLTAFVTRKTGGPRLPHDISPANLSMALLEGKPLVVSGAVAANFDATVRGMNLPKSLESRLLRLSATARQDVDAVRNEIEIWFTDFVAQVQHWYVRRAQVASLIIGLLVALCLNVDTIEIAKTLYHEPAKREAVAKLAVQIDKGESGGSKSVVCPGGENGTKGDIKKCLDEIEKVYPFRLGWNYPNDEGYKQARVADKSFAMLSFIKDKLFEDGKFKLLGLLLTGLALSLGARFWFDLLKKLVAIRTGGQPDAKAA